MGGKKGNRTKLSWGKGGYTEEDFVQPVQAQNGADEMRTKGKEGGRSKAETPEKKPRNSSLCQKCQMIQIPRKGRKEIREGGSNCSKGTKEGDVLAT